MIIGIWQGNSEALTLLTSCLFDSKTPISTRLTVGDDGTIRTIANEPVSVLISSNCTEKVDYWMIFSENAPKRGRTFTANSYAQTHLPAEPLGGITVQIHSPKSLNIDSKKSRVRQALNEMISGSMLKIYNAPYRRRKPRKRNERQNSFALV